MRVGHLADVSDMADYTRHFEKPAGSQLEPGEQFLAGTPCLPRGAIAKRALGAAVFGVAGDLVAASGSHSAGPIYVGQELPSTMALGSTQKRIIVFGMNVASGRPNKILYDIPIDAVANVESHTGRSIGMKKLEVDLTLTNGAVLSLDVPREHVKRGEHLVEAVTTSRRSIDSRPDNRPPAESPQPPSTAPGWYGVPDDPHLQNYWDGLAWTHQMRWDGSAWTQC